MPTAAGATPTNIIDVRTREGHDLWVLVHAEVQGAAQTQFTKRMFQHNG